LFSSLALLIFETDHDTNKDLEEAILGDQWKDRNVNGTVKGFTTAAVKVAEKKTDPNGFTLGVELTPAGVHVTDCCLLNYDEKAKWLEDQKNNQEDDVPTGNTCADIRYKGKYYYIVLNILK